MSEENTTPSKYLPDDTLEYWEEKDWLYEQYWGEMKSCRAIAADEEADEITPKRINRRLKEHGIPRRGVGSGNSQNSVSPFSGFYNGDEPSPNHEDSSSPKERWEKAVEGKKLTWEKAYDMENHKPNGGRESTL